MPLLSIKRMFQRNVFFVGVREGLVSIGRFIIAAVFRLTNRHLLPSLLYVSLFLESLKTFWARVCYMLKATFSRFFPLGARFSKAGPKSHSKISNLRLQSCFIHMHVLLTRTEVPFIQEVSGVYISPFLDTDELQFPLPARRGSGAFEKRTPGYNLTVIQWYLIVPKTIKSFFSGGVRKPFCCAFISV